MMDYDNYDEGLVHGHRWATEPAMPRPSTMKQSDDTLSATPIPGAATIDAGYDEGLVHGHTWAVTAPER